MSLTVHVGGTSLRGHGAYAEVRMTTTARGSGVLSWRMDPDRHRPLQWALNRPLFAEAGGVRVWSGHLAEVGTDGEYHAYGLPTLADATPALDAAGEPTNGDLTAITEAISRGALDGWRAVDLFPAWSGDAESGRTVAQLLDLMADDNGKRWAVSPQGIPYAYPAAPGAPDWHIRTPGYRYGYDATDLVTVLYGTYMAGVGTYAQTSITTGVQAIRREEWVDLTDRGIITAGDAQAALAGIAAAQGIATPAPTERVSIGWGELHTPGGTVQPPWRVKGGDTVRLWGATDGRSGRDYLDVRVDGTEYDDETGVAVLSFASAKPKGFAAAVEAIYAD